MLEVGNARVFLGDCREVLKALPDNSIDSVVTDPPYELGFMGKKWDSAGIAYDVTVWEECLRVLKPGGHILAFGGSRTFHRMAVAIEDAGFEIRDSIAWMYGSGFPKSLDVEKAINKAGGDGSAFAGVGTALKPAFEPIVVGRKPFGKGSTVAANVLEHGVGGLNIDASRIGTETITSHGAQIDGVGKESVKGSVFGNGTRDYVTPARQGRWPANVILDEYSAGLLDEQSGVLTSGAKKPWVNGSVASKTVASFSAGLEGKTRDYTADKSSGGASRFFYCAKASERDRNEGLEGLEPRNAYKKGGVGGTGGHRSVSQAENATPKQNFHPTVKPTTLMRYLIKLVTPAGGTVLDPFTGSGSTGKAALLDGYKFVGAELTEEYLPIIEGRLKWALQQQSENGGKLF